MPTGLKLSPATTKTPQLPPDNYNNHCSKKAIATATPTDSKVAAFYAPYVSFYYAVNLSNSKDNSPDTTGLQYNYASTATVTSTNYPTFLRSNCGLG